MTLFIIIRETSTGPANHYYDGRCMAGSDRNKYISLKSILHSDSR